MSFTRLGQACAEGRSLEETLVTYFAPTYSNTYAKTGSYSIRCDTFDRIGLGWNQTNKIRAGCHFLISAYGSDDYWPLYLAARGDTAPVHGIRIDTVAEEAHLYFDGVSVASKGFVATSIEAAKWLHCAIMFDGSTGELNAWIDGWDREFSYTDSGISTQYVNSVWSGIYGTSFQSCYIDNLYADEWDSEVVSERPPKKHFFYKAPTANGDFHDWTPVNVASNYQAVDDAPHNGDTDYNKATAGTLVDTFETSSISIPESTDSVIWLPRAVIPRALAKRNEVTQDANLRVLTYDGADFGYGDTKEYVGVGYQYWWSRLEEQPDGSAWNETDINAMEYGYQSMGTFT